MQAIIYNPARCVMQSGNARQKPWVIKLIQENTRFIDPVMGWIGNSDMIASEVKLTFESRESAISHAKKMGAEYTIIDPKIKKRKIKSYVGNFY